MTFDDEFTQDKSIDTSKWNGGAGGTHWCGVVSKGISGGSYMFREPVNNPCLQNYDGLTFSSTNGLEMRSPGYPSAAIQTGGTTAQNAKFIQKFGYWEARMKVPHSTNGEGKGIHSDFWMHPIPEDIKGSKGWLPEINVGERPTWNSSLEKDNNRIQFNVADTNGAGVQGYFGTSPLVDLSLDWHTYGMYWANDGSGPYGSIQFYLDGVPLLSSPYTVSSGSANMANGIYMFLSVDNDQKGGSSENPFMIQYVRVWRLDPNSSSSQSSSPAEQGPRQK